MNRTTERRSRALVSMLILALLSLGASVAWAVEVRGTLRVADSFGQTAAPSAEEERRDRYWDEWNGFLDPRSLTFVAQRDLAVVLTGEGDLAEEQPGFEIAGGGLWPTTIVTRPGTLEILNTDPTPHKLFAEGNDAFGVAETAPGLSRRVEGLAEGAWPVRDELYGHVRGHVHVVTDLVARATINGNGSYTFVNVPPGVYTLKIFRGAEVVHTQENVEVPDRDAFTIEPISLSGSGG